MSLPSVRAQQSFVGFSTLVLAAIAVSLAQPSSLSAQVVPSIEGARVVLKGVPPGSEAVIASVERRWIGYGEGIERSIDRVPDDDGDGAVVLTRPRDIGIDSIWFAWVAQTDEALLFAPSGGSLKALEAPLPTIGFGPDGGTPTAHLQNCREVELLLLRKSGSISRGIAADGGNLDLDLVYDGSISIDLGSLGPLSEGDEPPGPIASGDRLVGIDLRSLAYFLVEVPEALPGGGL